MKNEKTENKWSILLDQSHLLALGQWFISNKAGKKILKKFYSLPCYESGIPCLQEGMCKDSILIRNENIVIHCLDKLIIKNENNIIELRYDAFCSIENEVLSCMPDEQYKEVCHFL